MCFNTLCQGWPTSQRPTTTFPFVLLQRATSYTWAHMNITPISSSLKHVPLLSHIYCKYNTPTWQGQNFTSHLLLCMLFSGTSNNYVRAAWNRAKSHMRLASYGLATPALCYRPVVPNWWSMEPQGSTEEFLGVHNFYLYKMKAIVKYQTMRSDVLDCKDKLGTTLEPWIARSRLAQNCQIAFKTC